MKAHLVSIFTICLLMTGCIGNPYSAYFRSNHKTQTFLPANGDVDIVQIPDDQFHETVSEIKDAGWICIGNSVFTSRRGIPSQDLLLEQAQKLDCDKVLLVSKIIGVQTVAAVPVIDPGQTYTTTENGTFNSGWNYGNYSGTSTTTTPWSVGVQYVPTHIDTYEVGASFWRKPVGFIAPADEVISPAH